MTISAKIIADSISNAGIRITTFELEYPRFIHAEFMTHRLFSRNAASSRAIPIKTQIELIKNNPAMPSHWGKHQPGMQSAEECNNIVDLYGLVDDEPTTTREEAWLEARDNAIEVAEAFAEAGYHKQIVNRLLEPFAHIKVVCTATEYDNFFWLRKHADAQPEIRELAERMWEARQTSVPQQLQPGAWHVPYHRDGYWSPDDGNPTTLDEALAVSSSCCAQVSYRKLDDSLEKAQKIFKMLVESKPVHASPFEHQASPMRYDAATESVERQGVTHVDLDGNYWSANFRGWVQHRQLIEEHTCWNYDEDQG